MAPGTEDEIAAREGKKLYLAKGAFVNHDKHLRSLPEVSCAARFRAE
jgi:hypothetical protein